MPKFISSAGIPEPYFGALCAFVREPREKHISVTELLSPPRPLVLKARHWFDVDAKGNPTFIIDVDDLIGAFYGGAAHAWVQAVHDKREKKQSHISEYLMEETLSMPQMGFAVTGRPDLYHEVKFEDLPEEAQEMVPDKLRVKGNKIGIISDWKTAKAYSWARKAQDDYKPMKDQLDLYAMLLRWSGFSPILGYNGITITDWSQWGRGIGGSKYPPQAYIHVWHKLSPADDQVQLFADRFQIHREAFALPDEELPVCDREERWTREEGYAVMRVGNKRPTKVFKQDSRDPVGKAEKEAREYIKTKPKESEFSIIHRPGESVRCQSRWCLAYQVCSAGQKFRPPGFEGE
jgi:hypothetical protein